MCPAIFISDVFLMHKDHSDTHTDILVDIYVYILLVEDYDCNNEEN